MNMFIEFVAGTRSVYSVVQVDVEYGDCEDEVPVQRTVQGNKRQLSVLGGAPPPSLLHDVDVFFGEWTHSC